MTRVGIVFLVVFEDWRVDLFVVQSVRNSSWSHMYDVFAARACMMAEYFFEVLG